ncbi:hypothetical protein [Chromobacterium sp. LK1]|uniref:hypothetical protein n=1 Tax=Chromobacterium sp. LK1 TaxID=1628193 RepID=UPI00069FC60A|nr:hypothetical protein [Chromobacterium sp. LK1]
MIPIAVGIYLAAQKGEVFRSHPSLAAAALKHLGISERSQFGEFYMKYQGAFISPNDEPELLDIVALVIPAIPDQTEHIQSVYGIPVHYLALTTDESEGMYLYDKSSEAVLDVNFEEIPSLRQGTHTARWKDFNSFLISYFS